MKSKSDGLVVIPTPLDTAKAFIIFQNYWILADDKFLYQMSQNCQKLLSKLNIENTIYLYKTIDYLIVQTKEGRIIIVNISFEIISEMHINQFSFCKICILSNEMICMNSNQLQRKKLPSFETVDCNYFSETICSSIQGIKQDDEEYLVICLDNGIIDVLKNEEQLIRYELNKDKKSSIFIYDCSIKLIQSQLYIIVATNINKLFVLTNNDKQIIELSFSPTQIKFLNQNQISPIVALNKDQISLVSNKEICKYKFPNITNYFQEEYFYCITNEQIILIDFQSLKK